MRIALMIALLVTAVLFGGAFAPAETPRGVYALGHVVKNIDGADVDLSQYRGKVVLIVNVASKCGLTPQYADLEKLYETYGEKGLTILGFPANNFREQEPGTNAEIKEFCSLTYGVKFPMFSKISVAGDDIDPLYQDLISKEKNGEFGGEIGWNFTKFLVGRDGHVAARFEPRVKPSDPAVTAAIEAELAR